MAEIERLTPTEAKRNLATVLSKVEYGHKSIIVQRRGRDVAALVPMEMFELSKRLIEELEDEEDWQAMQKALADPENAVLLEWDRSRYEVALPSGGAPKRRQATAAGTRRATSKTARRNR